MPILLKIRFYLIHDFLHSFFHSTLLSFELCSRASATASVRNIDDFLVFKRTIKTYLFRKAFACYC